METCIRKINQSINNSNTSSRLINSLSRIAYDLDSMKKIKAPAEEISALECIWRELLKEYRELNAT